MQEDMKATVIDLIETTFKCRDVEMRNDVLNTIQNIMEEDSDYYGIKVCDNHDKYTTTEIVGEYQEQLRGNHTMDEIQKDWISFNHSLIVYNALVKHELNDCGYKSNTRDITLEAVTNIEHIAQKYNLYGYEWESCVDYLDDYVIPRLQKFFKEQNIGVDSVCLEFDSEGAKEVDYNAIEDHLQSNGVLGWKWDKDLQKWFYDPTGQTIREYILDNIETILSPDILKNYMEVLLFSKRLDHVLVNLTDMQLLSTITSKEKIGDMYQVQIIGETIDISPKQWREIVNEAVDRIMRRDE